MPPFSLCLSSAAYGRLFFCLRYALFFAPLQGSFFSSSLLFIGSRHPPKPLAYSSLFSFVFGMTCHAECCCSLLSCLSFRKSRYCFDSSFPPLFEGSRTLLLTYTCYDTCFAGFLPLQLTFFCLFPLNFPNMKSSASRSRILGS